MKKILMSLVILTTLLTTLLLPPVIPAEGDARPCDFFDKEAYN